MAEVSEKAVREYLSKHPDFTRKYFLEDVGHSELESWVEDKRSSSGSSNHLKHRKSINTALFQNLVQGNRNNRSWTRQDLTGLSEMEMFMELIRDVANELDVDVLCHKILLNVNILTNADRSSLFLTKASGDNKFLVSKLFDVSENSSLEESLHTDDKQIIVPFGMGIAGTVAQTQAGINIKDAYQDPRFNQEVDKKTGYHTKNLLCMPILNYDGVTVGVAQIINKTNTDEEFTKADQEVFKNYLTFCGIGLTNAQLFEMSVQEYKRNQLLLNLARSIFAEQSNLDNLVRKIMLESQELLKCERCYIYLIDNTSDTGFSVENASGNTSPLMSPSVKKSPAKFFAKPQEVTFEKVFGLHADTNDIINPMRDDIRGSASAELACEVATTGKLKNIADSLMDPLYKAQIIDYDGFKIRSLLSLPIKNSDDCVIGIVELMNKTNGKPFTDVDINVVEAFAIFCGLGIHNCQMYEGACKLMAKQRVALEVLSYHATAPQEDVDKIKNAVIPDGKKLELYTYSFNDFPLNEDDTVKATLRMFIDLDVLNKFHIPYEVLCRWTLSVKKNYRPVTYHNWRHAFNVAQTMFTMLYTGNMIKLMDGVETFALIVACLCHDLDHRGTNNAFQSKAASPLATLYSTSTMEHHHFDQCIMILNSEGNNIFGNMEAAEYKRCIEILESAILSTDLALYFKKRGGFEQEVKQGKNDWSDPEKKDLLRGMMMTACDVAAITKPWEVQKEVAQLVAGEFFEQGDMERNQLNQEPIAMMDRKKKEELPKMQVGFIDAICMPVYTLLSTEFEGLNPLLDGCSRNRDMWQQQIAEVHAQTNEVIANKRPSSPEVTKNKRPPPLEVTKNERPPPPEKCDDTKRPVHSEVVADKNNKNRKSKKNFYHIQKESEKIRPDSANNEHDPTKRSNSKTCDII